MLKLTREERDGDGESMCKFPNANVHILRQEHEFMLSPAYVDVQDVDRQILRRSVFAVDNAVRKGSCFTVNRVRLVIAARGDVLSRARPHAKALCY